MSRHHLCPKCNSPLVKGPLNKFFNSAGVKFQEISICLYKIKHNCNKCHRKNKFMIFIINHKIYICLNHYTNKIIELLVLYLKTYKIFKFYKKLPKELKIQELELIFKLL